ncbi:MAG TPA: prepilin-type N-terminal cleavage/methylation domain-containing protein [Gemmatimonadales bacterium]|nr:prepilin-type N-terminal cleavage/methylation domain-containing protein [Gemmatimonadales bacterium]
MRHGFTLVELLVVLAVVGLMAAIVVPGSARQADRIAVEHQALRILLAYRAAWLAAQSQQRLALLRIAPDSIAIRTVRSTGDPDTALVSLEPGPAMAGVTLQSPARTAMFGPDGLGLGISNTTHVLIKGGARRQVVVSRLGRVRVE